MRCDKAFGILADMSARFVHCREVFLTMEGKADVNGWTAEMFRCAHSRQGLTGVAGGRTQPHSHNGCAP